MERKYTRIDTVRNLLDSKLKQITDEELKRNAYVHLYGTGQNAAFLALKRGFDRKTAELAEIAGMLHDYTKYVSGENEDHAKKSAEEAKKLLEQSGEFSEHEINLIYAAIYIHDDKKNTGSPFEEILKDADEMHHFFRNPLEDYWFEKERVKCLLSELRIKNVE